MKGREVLPTDFRHEYKYVCTRGQLAVERGRLASLLKPDSHAGRDGSYFIRSVYFDDPDSVSYYENEGGDDPRARAQQLVQ